MQLTKSPATELAEIVHYFARAGGDATLAKKLAIMGNASSRVVNSLSVKDVAAAQTGSPGWFGNGVDPVIVGAEISALRHSGIFAAMWADNALQRAPRRTRILATSGNATGWIRNQGKPAPLSQMEIEGSGIDEIQAAALIAVSREVADSMSPAATNLISRNLRIALNGAMDSEFLARLVDSAVYQFDSSGNDADAARADIIELFDSVHAHAAQKLYFIMRPTTVRHAMFLMDYNGNPALPGLSVDGGQIKGVPVLISDAVGEGEVWLVDAGGICANLGEVEIRQARHASIEMLDENLQQSGVAPVQAASMVSLWQTNAIAIMTLVNFAVERLRFNTLAILENCTWGESTGS